MRVILIMTTTLDGFITRDAGEDAAWVEHYDKLFFDKETISIGTVVIGANAFRLLRHPFEGRLNIVMTSTPNPGHNVEGSVEFYDGEPKQLLADLADRDIQEVALIGGSQINASFLEEGLVTEIFMIVVPKLFGQGVSIASGYDLDIDLHLVDSRPLEEDVMLLHYEVIT